MDRPPLLILDDDPLTLRLGDGATVTELTDDGFFTITGPGPSPDTLGGCPSSEIIFNDLPGRPSVRQFPLVQKLAALPPGTRVPVFD